MRLLSRVVAVLAMALVAAPAGAESWPAKPVRLVVPYPPGGPADALGRLFANKLSEIWGQPVLVENRGGAAGNIGTQAVAKAPPDGSTFLLHSSSQVINAALYKQPGYDPIADFTPISEIAYYMLVVVTHPSLPVASLAELVAAAKATPGSISYASAGGAGAPTHLAVELFKRVAGIDLLHVPYAGAGPATTAILGGHVMVMFNNPLSALPHVRAGELRGLAVTGARRLPLAPELPTVAESGVPGFDVSAWYALFAPVKTPAVIVRKMNVDAVAALHDPVVKGQIEGLGLEIVASTPEELASMLKAEMEKWGPVIKDANIRAPS
jgi:tripartite-type tricarboxylate transporter receptor subunit TctC